jgi:hypothetical protein
MLQLEEPGVQASGAEFEAVGVQVEIQEVQVFRSRSLNVPRLKNNDIRTDGLTLPAADLVGLANSQPRWLIVAIGFTGSSCRTALENWPEPAL